MSASPPPRRAAAALLLCLGAGTAAIPVWAASSGKRAFEFAAEMAKIGNWREAKFRWDELLAREPDNPRLLNNLAVAAEALGDVESARERYARALAIVPGDTRIENNRLRCERFWRLVGNAGGAGTPEEPLPAELDPKKDSKAAGKGKPLKVAVLLPVPPRLDLQGARSILVASFLGAESALLDVDRELVRFLRAKLDKSALDVLPATPTPAVPEQTLEDLVANAEFWRHLGREHGADLILSGELEYGRRDVSGFVEVDRISESTGHKVRSTEFVEQEEFSYSLELIFMDGRSGELRFRDRLQRSAVYRGSQNDPISAFFQISESMTPDLMAIVAPREREDPRIVFKN